MYLHQLIVTSVPVLQTTNTVDDALRIMEESQLHHLPLVQDQKYIGLIKEEALLALDEATPLHALNNINFMPQLSEHVHAYEAIKLIAELNLDLIPIVSEEHLYMGSVTGEKLLDYITANGSLDKPGAVIVLEMDQHNYSLWELARITEAEGIKIWTAQVQLHPASGLMEITLKTDAAEIGGLVQAFERHEITVKQVYGDEEFNEDLAQRYHQLMHYINI